MKTAEQINGPQCGKVEYNPYYTSEITDGSGLVNTVAEWPPKTLSQIGVIQEPITWGTSGIKKVIQSPEDVLNRLDGLLDGETVHGFNFTKATCGTITLLRNGLLWEHILTFEGAGDTLIFKIYREIVVSLKLPLVN